MSEHGNVIIYSNHYIITFGYDIRPTSLMYLMFKFQTN